MASCSGALSASCVDGVIVQVMSGCSTQVPTNPARRPADHCPGSIRLSDHSPSIQYRKFGQPGAGRYLNDADSTSIDVKSSASTWRSGFATTPRGDRKSTRLNSSH